MGCTTPAFYLFLIISVLEASRKPCRFPINYAYLPDFAQEEITSIWRDWEKGTDCERQLRETQQVLSAISDFDSQFRDDDSSGGNDSSGPRGDPLRLLPPPRTNRPVRSSTISTAAEENYYDYQEYNQPPPTQGKVAKSLRKIGSPAFQDYGDPDLLVEEARKDRLYGRSSGTYGTTYGPIPTYITTSSPRYTRYRTVSTTRVPISDLGDYQTNNGEYDDFTQQFDTPNAPFLKGVSPHIKAEFEKLWSDENVPSESLRNEKIHLLAVSTLTGRQLEEYNRWATNRKKVLRAREQSVRRLSPRARYMLRRLSTQRDEPIRIMPAAIKVELIHFAEEVERKRRRRQLAAIAKRS